MGNLGCFVHPYEWTYIYPLIFCAKKTKSQDYGTLLLGLLLVLSVYRLPSVLRDLQRHQGDFVHRARMVLTCQARVRVRNFVGKKISSKDPLKMNMRQKSPGEAFNQRLDQKLTPLQNKSKNPIEEGRVKRNEKKDAGHFFWRVFIVDLVDLKIIGKMLVPLGWHPGCLTPQGAL